MKGIAHTTKTVKIKINNIFPLYLLKNKIVYDIISTTNQKEGTENAI